MLTRGAGRSLAGVHAELLLGPPEFGERGRFFRCDVYRHYRSLHLIRYALLAHPSAPCLTSTAAIPIALRVIYARKFVRGPFHLGPFSFPVAITAVVWIAFISIAFILPSENPVNSQTLNYAIVAVGIVLAYCMGFWVLSARKWFTGPIKQIEGTCDAGCLWC